MNCSEFFQNPYGVFEDVDSREHSGIEAAMEARPGILASGLDEPGREPVIINVYDMFWTNEYTGRLTEYSNNKSISIHIMCPDDTATASSWAGSGLVN
jgi:hypothetical protein